MDIARNASVEIDRLVLTLNHRISTDHGRRMREQAAAAGLDSLDMLPHFEDWLSTGTLTREVATTRLRYRPPADVLARLDHLVAQGFASETADGIAATPKLVPVLDMLLATRAEVGRDTWSGYEDQIGTVARLGRVVADATSPDHIVAVSHRALPDPEDPYLRLEHRLFTLRYIRQHDHAEAWLTHGLTAREMVAYTRIWESVPPDDAEAVADLAAAGLVSGDPPRLTPHGRALRDEIEDDTNQRAQVSFDVLGPAGADELLNALRRLPSAA